MKPARPSERSRLETGATSRPDRRVRSRLAARAREVVRSLGPGLITGAADDDPSGVSTYSQAGAAFGYGMLWTALVSLPLMIGVQLVCARIGTVSRSGLASVLRGHYSRWILWGACLLLLVANTVNIAADLGGMSAAATMITHLHTRLFVPLFAALIMALLVFASYAVMTRLLKGLSWALFAYVIAAFLAHPQWDAVLRGTFVPRGLTQPGGLLTLVAILGTTISPYLFFWQAAQNAEEEEHLRSEHQGRAPRSLDRELRDVRTDVTAGMLVSNGIMYFIILTAGATLHRAGLTQVQTAEQAAAALRPLAGPLASVLFATGIVGTGLLGVPVLAGSAAYAVAEAWGWARGMDERPEAAPHFYLVMGVATVLGVALDFARFDPIRLLFWSAVINGLLAPPLIVLVLVVGNNPGVMGRHRNGWGLNVLCGAAGLAMGASAVALIISWL